MKQMKIRDGHATISKDTSTYTPPSGGIEIIADDDRALWSIRVLEDGSLEVQPGGWAKHNGILLDDRISIRPVSANMIVLSRPEYK